jgi:TRAP-type C4-dicarboxylate transport system substrate-binding protein
MSALGFLSLPFLTRAIVVLGLLAHLPAAGAGKLVIKTGTIAPEGSVWHDALLEIRQRWSKLSDGTVELRIYAGGVLGDETEMIRKVQRRGLDAIAISGSGLPRVDESVSCLNIPMLFESYDELDYIRDRIAPKLEQRIEKRGFRVLTWGEAGWLYFFTKHPVRTPSDLRQLRLWISPGFPEHEKIFKSFGFQVVPLPATDMLTSLQTGLIEAVDVPPLFALIDRSYQIANHMTDLRWAPLNAAMVISSRSWARIPGELQQPFLDAVREIGERLRRTIRGAESDAIREMVSRGLKVVSLDSADREAWRSEVNVAYSRLPCRQSQPDLLREVMRLHEEYSARGAGAAAR